MARNSRFSAPEVTAERLRLMLDYDPTTGVFVWRKPESNFSQWRVGSVAGTDCNGYLAIVIDGRSYKAHRLAWLYFYGGFPPDQIDHLDLDRRNNRIKNLRPANYTQNNTNKKVRVDCRSGYKGVQLQPKTGKWRARLGQDHLGLFDTPQDANAAYAAAAIDKYGSYANAG